MPGLITEEAIRTEDFINKAWPKLKTKKEVPLRELFEEPENRGLKHIWTYGAADVVVYNGDRIVAVFEPGGSHHLTDEKQKKNDNRKFMLCKKNGVRYLKFANSVIYQMTKRQMRRLFGKYLYSAV